MNSLSMNAACFTFSEVLFIPIEAIDAIDLIHFILWWKFV